MIKTAIVFDYRGRTKPGKEGPLEVRTKINRKTYYINTGIKVRKSEFKAGAIVDRPDSDILNVRLRVIVQNIENIINEYLIEGRELDVAEIKRQAWVMRQDAASTSLLEWIDQQINLLTVKEGTAKHYDTLYRRLKEFGEIKRWSDLTIENIYKFDAWLHKLTKPQTDAAIKAGEKPEVISDSAVYNYHKCFKAILNRAVLFDRLQVNPYERLKGKFKRGDQTEKVDYLTDEEMDAFVALKPIAGTKMSLARDLFVFQMYTGLAFSDMQSFDIKDYKLIDGVWRNTGERIKTGVPYTSQLLPPVVDVLERYGWQIPKIDNADYNRCLKALGMACGIERPIHSHMARHTFATYMLRHGVKIEHVSKMLGHTNITQTQRYAKIVAQDIHDDFSMIAEKMKK